ncbi:MAG: STAS domain-containing protein [Bacillota bacterium]
MEIKVRQQEGKTALDLNGELDFSNVEELQREIQRQPVKLVEVDLQGIRFIDSSGVGMLLSQARLLNKQGRTLRIVGIPDYIKEDLEVIGFFRVLEVLDTQASA